MNTRKTFAWAATWSGIAAIVGVAAGIMLVGSPAAPPVVHNQPAAVVQPLDAPADTTTTTPDPTTTTEQPVTTTNDPAPTDTTVDTPPSTSTAVELPPVNTSDHNPPAGSGPIGGGPVTGPETPVVVPK